VLGHAGCSPNERLLAHGDAHRHEVVDVPVGSKMVETRRAAPVTMSRAVSQPTAAILGRIRPTCSTPSSCHMAMSAASGCW
jgi:hypothetical protein